MKLFTKWIESVIYPGSYQIWAAVLSLGIAIGLSHWHRIWLPSQVHEWLTAQGDVVKIPIYSAACVVVFLVTSFVVFRVIEKVKDLHPRDDPVRRARTTRPGDRWSYSVTFQAMPRSGPCRS